MTPLRRWYHDHGKTTLLTFEIFWILVFLLAAAADGGSLDVAQFVYVNF